MVCATKDIGRSRTGGFRSEGFVDASRFRARMPDGLLSAVEYVRVPWFHPDAACSLWYGYVPVEDASVVVYYLQLHSIQHGEVGQTRVSSRGVASHTRRWSSSVVLESRLGRNLCARWSPSPRSSCCRR